MIISSSTAMAKPSFPHISSLLLLILLLTLSPLPGTLAAGKLSLKEATIDDIQHAFKHNQLTSRQLVQYYLVQIRKLNPVLKGVLEVNPDALHLADKADYERKTKAPVSLLSKLHGIPILVKDNIATKDKMNTTAGSLALLGSVVPRDAGVVEKLRKAGAIILGKASLSEWSHFRGAAPSGWSARGGYGLNPYTFSDPCGSSSGSAISVAANLAMVSLGTETDGSILCPSGYNSVVGIKPTIGLTSRAGVVPISQRQDTVGPICRTVADAAYVLDAIAGIDHNDIATIETSKYIPKGGYAQFLRRDGLRGKRIGILRAFYDFGNDTSLAQTFEKHLTILRKAGAVLVDNLEVANWTAIYSSSDEINALSVECKISLNAYLKELVASPVRSLADVIAFNNKHQKLEKIKEYGQELFLAAEATNGFGKTEKAALLNLARWTRNGLVRLVTEKKLDAVVTPKEVFSSVLAIGGAPGLIVPAGYENNGRPAGICFGGLRGSEPKLIEIAYAFEQAKEASFLQWPQVLEQHCIMWRKQYANPYNSSLEVCGSSSGSAISVSANMVSVALGTETDSSILCPASFNSVVGFKPTVGLTSRAGVIPVSPRQDTIGPICRTVADAVHVLDTIVGIDSNDNTTSEVSQYIPVGGYGQFLNSNGLKGKRLGIVSRMFLPLKDDAFLNQTFEQHFTILREQGVILVENLEIANLEDIRDFTSSGEFVAMLAEFKIALNAYLGDLVKSPVRTLGEVIAFNKNNSYLEKNDDYGQNLLEAAEETKGMGAKELEALSNIARLSRDGFEKLMTDKNLDALVTYANTASSILAIGGFPGIVVPAGYHDTDKYPFGICFGGLKGSEPKLIEIAYAFEQATMIRKPPTVVSHYQSIPTTATRSSNIATQ
ncbi:hypothetical protein ACLB2K_012373 [Fragaria x ananassa]